MLKQLESTPKPKKNESVDSAKDAFIASFIKCRSDITYLKSALSSYLNVKNKQTK